MCPLAELGSGYRPAGRHPHKPVGNPRHKVESQTINLACLRPVVSLLSSRARRHDAGMPILILVPTARAMERAKPLHRLVRLRPTKRVDSRLRGGPLIAAPAMPAVVHTSMSGGDHTANRLRHDRKHSIRFVVAGLNAPTRRFTLESGSPTTSRPEQWRLATQLRRRAPSQTTPTSKPKR